VEELDVYRQAETVFAYVDHANEVMTRDFIRRALRGGKNVAVPKVEGEKMRFWYMTDFSQLRPGIFGIEEPVTGEEGMSVCADDAEDALMIVPGVAFDSGCHRVGFGGGFYDRYLQTHPLHETIAVAFEEQIYASVPCEDHDRLMHMVVTPSRIICR
jgi:5-formyltetrahydrofolate cyclo-ligase